MGASKELLLEQWEKEREQEAREWFKDKYGRAPSPDELVRAWSDFELDEAFEYAMSKDD